MRSFIFVYIFYWFSIVQGELFYQDKIKNFYKCWTDMNCLSDGPMAQERENCLQFLKPEDLQFYFEYIEEHYNLFRNHTVRGALSEYCNTNGDEQKDLFNKMMDALQSSEKVVDAKPQLTDLHFRGSDSFNCVLHYLETHFPKDDCKID